MSYSRLTVKDRIRISCYRKQGKSQAEIARLLGFHRSTICREVRRNKHIRKYDYWRAHKYARNRQKVRRYPYKLNPVVLNLIEERLQLKWSPEQIYWRLHSEGETMVSIETIYKYIYLERKLGGNLWLNLRRAHKVRRRRLHSRAVGKVGHNPRSISLRSKAVNQRKSIGHWERDTMSGGGHQAGVLVFTERKTRFNKFVKLKTKKALEVTNQTIKIFKDLPCTTITNDRGQEFSDHQRCANEMRIKIFFCDAYSPQQRGTNENRIGILRQYLHKQFDPKTLTQARLNEIELEINNRPMKCLDWKTPYEVMVEKVLH